VSVGGAAWFFQIVRGFDQPRTVPVKPCLTGYNLYCPVRSVWICLLEVVTLVEQNPIVGRQLQDNQQLLGLEQLSIQQADALSWLEQEATAFDIVFLDPPFADQLLSECCLRLDQNGWLANNPRIYLEWDLNGPLPKIPAHWQALKEKKAGQVAYALYTR
jgi:16S rRNA (guanine966-N2)-methyltransferase